MYNDFHKNQIFNDLKEKTLLKKLHALELIFAQKNALSEVIHCKTNELLKNGYIIVEKDEIRLTSKTYDKENPFEYSIIETLKISGATTYETFVKQAVTKPIFQQIKKSITAIFDEIKNSEKVTNLFLTNFTVSLILFLLLMVRLQTGIERDKPIAFLVMITVVFLIIALCVTNTLYDFFRKKLIRNHKDEAVYDESIKNLPDWQFLLLGYAILPVDFRKTIQTFQSSDGGSDVSSSSSCGGGNSDSSGCSSGCGGCGGGD